MTFKSKLIAVTKPVVDGIEDAQELIAFCARVSNPSNQMNMDTSEKLLNYLKKHKHWSPFEMANCVVEVESPRDIARQLLRHGSFKFQEFSQRYADVTSLASTFVLREARLQDPKNRQSSVLLDMNNPEHIAIAIEWNRRQQAILDLVDDSYQWGISVGMAKECVRVILPEGNTMSRLYVNGTIRSWIHYLEVRMEKDVTQEEHVWLATTICEQVNTVFNVTPNYVAQQN